jgi:predicted ester cyclase
MPEKSARSAQTEESKSLLRRITEEIWTNGRLELIDELIAEGLVDHIEMPGLEDLSGRAHYRASVEMIRNAFPDYREEIVWMIAEGDRAVSYARCTGTNTGPLHGSAATGRRFEVHSMGALRFSNGRAVERWGIGDTMAMMQQLGYFG